MGHWTITVLADLFKEQNFHKFQTFMKIKSHNFNVL